MGLWLYLTVSMSKTVICYYNSDQNAPLIYCWGCFNLCILLYNFQAKYTDIQCINRYYGWFQDTGHTEIIQMQVTSSSITNFFPPVRLLSITGTL